MIFTMTKIPAIILVKLMLGLGSDQEEVAESLVGAYAICMDPHGEPPRTWAHSLTIGIEHVLTYSPCLGRSQSAHT